MAVERNLVLTYLALVLIWATTPLAIVWSVTEIAPLWGLVLRFALALPLLLLVLFALRIRVPLHPQALHSYLAGASSMAVCQFFTYLATEYLSSGIIALMFGFAPIVAGIIGWLVFGLRLRALQWAGLFVAIGGLLIIFLQGGEASLHPVGLLIMVASLLIYASSIFWVKHVNAPISPMAQAAGSILVSSLLCCLLLPFIWDVRPTEIPSPRTLLALGFASTVATIVGMLCYFRLIQNVSAATISLTTVITPMFALAIGVVFNGEHIYPALVIGSAIAVAGLLLYFSREIAQLRHKQLQS